MAKALLRFRLLGFVVVMGGCGDDEGTSAEACSIVFGTVNGAIASNGLKLDASDDQSEDAAGIQVDIVVTASGLTDGTEVVLSGGVAPATGSVAGEQVTFPLYTLTESTDMKQLTLSTQTVGACEIATLSLIVNPEGELGVTCQIVAPKGTLNRNDDLDPATTDALDVDVLVSTNAPDGAVVSFGVTDSDKPTRNTMVDGSVATFEAVPFECGDSTAKVTLNAAVVTKDGLSGECDATVTVNCGFNECEILSFSDANDEDCPTDPSLGQVCNAQNDSSDDDGLQIGVVVSSDSADGTVVTLEADGSVVGAGTVMDGQAILDVTLPEGTPALIAFCEDEAANTRESAPFTGFLVDTVAPATPDDLSCSVTGNDPGEITCMLTVPDDGAEGSGANTVTLCNDTDDDLDDASCATAAATVGGSEQSIETAIDATGCYFFAAVVEDAAGNPSDAYVLPSCVGLAGACTLSALDAMLNVTEVDLTVSTDVGTGGAVTLSVNDTVSDPADVVEGAAAFTPTLTEGSVTFVANCTDDAGNDITSDPTTVFVDSIAPAAITDLSCTVTDNRAATITCTWTPPAEAGSGLGSYELRYVRNGSLDDSDAEVVVATPGPAATATTYDLTRDADDLIRLGSSYDIELVSTDLAGNPSLSSSSIDQVFVTLHSREFVGLQDGDSFGFAMSGGDFNCDGVGDVAITAGTSDTTAVDAGKVFLFFGTIGAGLPDVADAQIVGSVANGFLGVSISSLGDFNGDGCDDLAVSGGFADGKGRANVYLGRSFWFDRGDTEQSTGADLVIQGGSLYGYPLAGIGDFNHDGLNDLAAYDFTEEIHITYGRVLTTISDGISPTTIVSADETDIRFHIPGSASGAAITALGGGNANGDLFSDLIVGAPSTDAGSGTVYVLFGATADESDGPEAIVVTSDRVARFDGGLGENFGKRATIRNVDGSESSLVATGNAGPSMPGAVYVIRDIVAGTFSAPDVAYVVITNVEENSENDNFGTGLATGQPWNCGGICDIDGDNQEDIVVATSQLGDQQQHLLAYFGSLDFTDRTSDDADLLFGTPGVTGQTLAFAPDPNGDGFVDLLESNVGAFGGPGISVVYLYQ